MNEALAQLTALLNSLGPWGIVAGVVLTVAVPRIVTVLKSRFPNIKLPSFPAAPTVPAPAPVPVVPTAPLLGRPVLDLILASLRQILASRNPGKDPDTLLESHLASQVGIAAHVPTESQWAEEGIDADVPLSPTKGFRFRKGAFVGDYDPSKG